MKPIRMQYVIAAIALLASPSILVAGITDIAGPPIQETDYLFGSIEVSCAVYQIGTLYLYTYDLANPIDSLQSASWFSVGILPGVDIVSVGYDTSQTEIVPALWHDIGDPISSVDAQFLETIDPGESSTTLFYLSSKGPGQTSASLGGVAGNESFVYQGKITSPVPEPATVLFLAAGALMSLRRKL